MVRSIFVIAFGALPVLPLAFFAGYGVIIGFQMLVDNPSGGILLVVWGSAGLCGAAALWLAAFNVRHIGVVVGLLVGCVAISPIAYWIPQSSDWVYLSIHSLVLLGPLMTACALVGEAGFRIAMESPDRRKTGARFLFVLCMAAIALSILSIVLSSNR